MKLSELNPKWLSLDVFSFDCPHCRNVTLLCKRIPLPFHDQVRLVNPTPEDADDWPIDFIPMNQAACWTISGQFDSMTITPSIDASASGHWHGHITNGEIR